MEDPRGGVWFWCSECGYNGSLLDVYMQKTSCNVTDAHKALANAMTGQLWIPTNYQITAYEAFLEQRQKMLTFRDLAVNRIKHNIPPQASRILEQWGCKPLFGLKWLNSVGICTGKEVLAYTNQKPPGRSQFYLAIFRQDVPGRISCVELYGPTGNKYVFPAYPGNNIPGVAFMECLFRQPKSLIILPTVKQALIWYRHAAMDAYLEAAAISLDTYNTKLPIDTILVTNKLTTADIITAAHVDAKICLCDYAPQPYTWLKKQSKDWIDVLEGWIATADCMTIGELSTRGLDKPKMLSLALSIKPERATKLRRLADSIGRKTFTMGPHEIFETDAGYYFTIKGKNTTELLCEAIVKIDYMTAGEPGWFSGRIRMAGKEIGFHEPCRTLERSMAEWLKRQCRVSGLGYPFIHPYFKSKILDICQKLSSATTIAPIHIGWSDDRLVLPKFAIENGTFIDSSIGVEISTDLPCAMVDKPKEPSEFEWKALQDEDTLITIFGLARLIAANICSSKFKQDTFGIGVNCPPNSVSWPSVVNMCNSLGIIRVKLDTNPDVLTILSQLETHDIPVLVDMTDVGLKLLNVWSAVKPHQIIIQANKDLSDALAIKPGWAFIKVPEQIQDTSIFPWLVWSFVAESQNHSGELMNVFDEILKKALIKYKYKHLLPTILANSDTSGLSNNVLLDRFGQLLHNLAGSGYMSVGARQTSAISINPATKIVSISKTRFVESMRSKGLPLPDMNEITKAMSNAGILRADHRSNARWFVDMEWWANFSTGNIKLVVNS